MSNPWKLRTATNQDISFLFSSWLKSFRESPTMQPITTATYYDYFHRTLESVYAKSAVIVACDPEDPNTVYGYAVAELKEETLVLHWVYVKFSFRGFGIAKAMEAELLKIPHKTVAFSCRTRTVDSLNKNRKYVYNPFLLWRHASDAQER